MRSKPHNALPILVNVLSWRFFSETSGKQTSQHFAEINEFVFQCSPEARKLCTKKKGNWESSEINGFGEAYKRGSGTEVTSSDFAHSPVLTLGVVLPGKTALSVLRSKFAI